MSNRSERHYPSSGEDADWPGPMDLWQKISGVLAIVMLLAAIAAPALLRDGTWQASRLPGEELIGP
jgi:hypothetical protein